MNLTLRKTSRELFEERFPILEAEDRELVNELRSQRRQLVDACYYSTKKVGAVKGSYDSIFASDDDKVDGKRNVSNAKLDPGRWLLVNQLMILSGTAQTLEEEAFEKLGDDVRQGEIEILVDRKPIITRQPIEALIQNEMVDNQRAGFAYLDNPKLIKPETEIQVKFWFPQELAADTNLKVGFIGTTIDTY